MAIELYDRVALNVVPPGQDVRPGDVATLVEVVEHPSGGPRGCAGILQCRRRLVAGHYSAGRYYRTIAGG